MSKLTICFVSRYYPPETGSGGVSIYTHTIAHALANAGHRVVVLAGAVGDEKSYWDDGVYVCRIRPAIELIRVPLLWRVNRYWSGYRTRVAVKLRQIVNEWKVDLIESAEVGSETLLYSYVTKTRPPLVTRLHSGDNVIAMQDNVLQPRFGRILRWLEKRSIERADFITAPSHAIVAETRKFVHLRNDRLAVFPNPFELSEFKVNSFTPTKRDDSQLTKVVCIAHLHQHKGVHVLAQAIPQVIKEMPDTEFVFVGEDSVRMNGGYMSDYMYSFIPNEHKKRVRFEGRLPRQRIAEILSQATICIVPSLWDNFPTTVLEAMAAGIPTVASRVGGIPEQLDDGISGILVDPNDPKSLANAILNLLKKPEYRTQLGIEAQNRMNTLFRADIVAETTASTYRRIIQSQRLP